MSLLPIHRGGEQNCSILSWNVHFAHLQGGFLPLRLLVQMVSVDPCWWDVGKALYPFLFVSAYPLLCVNVFILLFASNVSLWHGCFCNSLNVLLTFRTNVNTDLILLALFRLFRYAKYKHQQQALQLPILRCLASTEPLHSLSLLWERNLAN